MCIFVNNWDSIAEDKSPSRRQLLFSDVLIHRSAPLPELHSFPSILSPPPFLYLINILSINSTQMVVFIIKIRLAAEF